MLAGASAWDHPRSSADARSQVNLAIRWFTGYGLHERLPDHSSLTRIRQRVGRGAVQRIFQQTVQACVV
jgi:IS5 family transposase